MKKKEVEINISPFGFGIVPKVITIYNKNLELISDAVGQLQNKRSFYPSCIFMLTLMPRAWYYFACLLIT